MNRRTFIQSAAGAAILAGRAPAAGKQYLIYWGTYTTPLTRFADGKSKGIYVSKFDSGTGTMSAPEVAAETKSPSYLTIHPSRKFLYAANELGAEDTETATGYITAFAIDPKTGKLKELNHQTTKGVMPCHLNVDKTGSMLAAANWSSGSTVSMPVRKDGSLGELATFYQHTGERSGVPPTGQPVQYHCHSVNFSPDNRFLIATDTSLNKVFVHRIDTAKATFTPNQPPYLGLKHQANPRQFRFHPNAKWAYIANESGPGCTQVKWDAKTGTFEEGPTARTLPESSRDRANCAEVEVHPSGKFVYLSNRNHNSIAIMSIDQSTGAPSLVEAFSLAPGNNPRSFNIDPTGNYLFVGLQRSNEIMQMKIDPATGKLTKVGASVPLSAPVCAKFVEVG